MKQIVLFLLLAVYSLSVSAQAPSKKCPVCGLSIPKCQYKGKHPKPEEKKCTTCGLPVSKCQYKGKHPKPTQVPSSTNILSVTAKGVTFNMVKVDGGTFTMGATAEMEEPFDWEKPTHQVTLSSYYIGETEVTQALWKAVMGSNPSHWQGDDLPVEQVSWNDCQDFIRKLNEITKRKFRLPTEAEWEFAARGGNKSRHTQYSGSSDIGEVAWYDGNSGRKTHPVKTKKANELGIYDMSGNVWEWCQDWYGSYSSEAQTNPTGATSGTYRVYRGGGWHNDARYCRSSSRARNAPDSRNNFLGFRLVLSE